MDISGNKQTYLLNKLQPLSYKQEPHFRLKLNLSPENWLVDLTNYNMVSPPGDLSIFSLGQTAVQGKFALVDSGSVARLNAAKENVKYNGELTKQYQSDLTYVMLAQFLNSQRLKRKLETIQTTLDRDAEIEKLADARVAAGVGLVLDLDESKGSYRS